MSAGHPRPPEPGEGASTRDDPEPFEKDLIEAEDLEAVREGVEDALEGRPPSQAPGGPERPPDFRPSTRVTAAPIKRPMAVAKAGVKLNGFPSMASFTGGMRKSTPASANTMAADFVGFIFVILNYSFAAPTLEQFGRRNWTLIGSAPETSSFRGSRS